MKKHHIATALLLQDIICCTEHIRNRSKMNNSVDKKYEHDLVKFMD